MQNLLRPRSASSRRSTVSALAPGNGAQTRRLADYPRLTLALAVAAGASLAFAPASRAAGSAAMPGLRLAAAPRTGHETVSMRSGTRLTLPYANVTRVITDDDEVARAFFRAGRAVIEGVSSGDTTVEVYQGTQTPRLLAVQVQPAADTGGPTGGVPLINPPANTSSLPPIEAPITPAHSPLNLVLSVAPAEDAPSQALFTINYSNSGSDPVADAVVRFNLDEAVSYVTGSASNGGTYDPTERQVVWHLGTVPPNVSGERLRLRVQSIERKSATFESVATIEDATGSAVVSNQVRYSTATTPLLTVFALPDRFLAGTTGPVLVDVKGIEDQSAVDRLENMGVVKGREPGLFYPGAPTQRAEYAVMTLNGLNLRDLRDLTQIKFVLGRRSSVLLTVKNSSGVRVATLVKDGIFDAGEHTCVWNGRSGTAFVAPGRYTYTCTARDGNGEVTTLSGNLTIVPQTTLEPQGMPSFTDVKPTDWYATDLAIGEKQGLLFGYADKTFRPTRAISRVEATAIVVRALGMEDLARQWADKDVGFLDYQNIDPWARGYVNVASTVAKTANGRPVMRGEPNNFFYPQVALRRDEAALIVQRLIDRDTSRKVPISGAVVPGATVSINSTAVEADENGRFAFSVDTSTSQFTTVAVSDGREP